MKKLALLVVLVAIITIVLFAMPQKNTPTAVDEKNTAYTIDGRSVPLINGASEQEHSTVRYFGNEIRKDLNGDGKEDIAFLLTEDSEGSGTYFYLVAAIASDNGYVGSNAYLLGDRIAPHSTESGPGLAVIVNYADRLPDESFTAQPSVGMSAQLVLDPESLTWSNENG